jgi:hypothetical protein
MRKPMSLLPKKEREQLRESSMKTLRTTLDLRMMLLSSLDDLVNKRITPYEARARSHLAQATLETVRLEMIHARTGLISYAPVDLIPPPDVIDN